MNLFEYIYPRFYFDKTKPIRLFEAFSGIGCQAMALKRITSNFELVGFSEIDKPAIQSYKAIHGEVKNYGDITKMEKIPECDIFTYSFPCQDLSLAGKQKGLGQGTRSGLVYEVLRLLHNTEKKPKVLIMENVSALISATFVNQFNEIQLELEQLGYKNYNEVLNAKDYGIPQNRERIFMVSILGDYSYTFPEPIKLELRLKDMLEDEVDEKYYLTNNQIVRISNWNAQQKPLENIEKEKVICPTLTARGAGEEHSGMVLISEKQNIKNIMTDVASTLGTNCGSSTSAGGGVVLIPEATKKGYAEAHDGDGIYLNRPHQKRGVVQKDMIQTLKTSGDDIGVAVKSLSNLRIRKLTPKECWRLMGISDDDFNKARLSGMSNSQLYKQAGNGIVVNVFEAILRELIK